MMLVVLDIIIGNHIAFKLVFVFIKQGNGPAQLGGDLLVL